MADRQTAGGYPKIGAVIAADLPMAGQLAPGDFVEFAWCRGSEAAAALIARERPLLRVADARRPRDDVRVGRRARRLVHARRRRAGALVLARATDETSLRGACVGRERTRSPVQVLGGGSNVVIADDGFDGLVVQVDIRGVERRRRDRARAIVQRRRRRAVGSARRARPSTRTAPDSSACPAFRVWSAARRCRTSAPTARMSRRRSRRVRRDRSRRRGATRSRCRTRSAASAIAPAASSATDRDRFIVTQRRVPLAPRRRADDHLRRCRRTISQRAGERRAVAGRRCATRS